MKTQSTPKLAAVDQPRFVRLLKLYAPKRRVEMVLYKADWQKDQIPRDGIWETAACEECSTDPLFTLRCVMGWGNSSAGDTVKVRERLMIHAFERIEIKRTPIEPNDESSHRT